jgi:hypothetical protein
VTRTPDFDDLVGNDVEAGERERLLRVHDLLLQAGPPPEISPDLEAPTLAMTIGARKPRRAARPLALLAAALVALVLAFVIGYAVGNGDGNGLASGQTLELAGTKAAPDALASLRVQPMDTSGNFPMTLAATGLPKLPPRGYYTVWLMRGPRPLGPCGTFKVEGEDAGINISLNAPYPLKQGDWWAITRQMPGQHDFGTIVLKPKRA